MLNPPAVAKRPDFSKQVLSREDLAELQRRLSQMGVTGVQDFYRTRLACRFDENHFPSARAARAGACPGVEADENVAMTRFPQTEN